jgi:hypothetical protein
MPAVDVVMRGVLLGAMLASRVCGQGVLGGEEARRWAEARARDRWQGFSTWGPGWRGETRWEAFRKLSYPRQTQMLLELFKDVLRVGDEGDQANDRRAALILLGRRPLAEWAPAALGIAGPHRDELLHVLVMKGYRAPGPDPWSYLAPYSRLERPWTHGLGLHLDGGESWRFQWIPSPVLMSGQAGASGLPRGLEAAAQPGVLIHLAHLRAGLNRLAALAGPAGDSGLVGALAQGTRSGFLLRHLAFWLDRAQPALAALADREAWVLHYGQPRDGGPARGTLVFLPGSLPLRARLALDLLRLNPLSAGARSRSTTWTAPGGGAARIIQVRAIGGVLNLASTPEGTWLCDGEAPLRALLFPGPQATLGERPEWCRRALAGMRPDTDVSLWLAPRLGAGDSFELAAFLMRVKGVTQSAWPNPALAKAAPAAGTLAAALGAGPTETMLGAILRADSLNSIADPPLPGFLEGRQALTADQAAAYQADLARTRLRRDQARALRAQLDLVDAALDLRGAALYWNGWVSAPPLAESDRAALAQFQTLRREDPHRATDLQRQGRAGLFGGYGEPGLAPSLALALAVKPGQGGAVRAGLGRLLPLMFQGQPQKRAVGGAELHRLVTGQAFRPSFALVGDILVLGSDDAAVGAVAAGLMGQAPTLADRPSQAFGRCRLDGALAARDLETLLLAYTRAVGHGSPWWWLRGEDAGDDAAGEVGAVFGPFLGALRGLGQRALDLEWGPWGLEARPR